MGHTNLPEIQILCQESPRHQDETLDMKFGEIDQNSDYIPESADRVYDNQFPPIEKKNMMSKYLKQTR